jgi:hypothetical protein
MAGCGQSTGTLKGKVSINGTQLKGGKISFYCADGRSFLTEIQEDGSYIIAKLPPGKAKICVDTSQLNPATSRSYKYSAPPGKMKDVPASKAPGIERYVEIPAKYANPETTDLSIEITPGSKQHDVEMK